MLTYADWLLMQKKTGSYRFNFSKTLLLFFLKEFVFFSLSVFSFFLLSLSLSLCFPSLTSQLNHFLDSQVSRHSLSSFSWGIHDQLAHSIQISLISLSVPLFLSFSTSFVAYLVFRFPSLFSHSSLPLRSLLSSIHSFFSFNSSLV